VRPREDVVHAKGKGELKTFLLEIGASSDPGSYAASSATDSSVNGEGTNRDVDRRPQNKTTNIEKYGRLIEWNVDILAKLLKQVVTRRVVASGSTETDKIVASMSLVRDDGRPVLDDVQESIQFLPSEATVANATLPPLDNAVFAQLRCFVTSICAMYRDDNPCKL